MEMNEDVEVDPEFSSYWTSSSGRDVEDDPTPNLNMEKESEAESETETASGNGLVNSLDYYLENFNGQQSTAHNNAKFNNSSIKAIDSSTVGKICSGQVIVSLSVGVKELVENALDAGGTVIDIRLVDFGSSLIEVSDNGSGVPEHNYEGLAMKHHTSKLREFEDLGSIGTFGFRGEALSSLSALGDLIVTTRSRSDDSKIGVKLEYNARGILVRRSAFSREFGTTISLSNIFASLPVRRSELLKNLKREYHKMINVLYAYCLIAKGVRVTVTNQVEGGSVSKIISIPSTHGTRERIVGVFGAKQLHSLLEFRQEELLDEETLEEFGLNVKTFVSDRFAIEGLISKPNQGRSSNDRQFFYVNSRPCDFPKIQITESLVKEVTESIRATFLDTGIKDHVRLDLGAEWARRLAALRTRPPQIPNRILPRCEGKIMKLHKARYEAKPAAHGSENYLIGRYETLSKIINEVYHGYSRAQAPFVFLNVTTRDTEGVDINVTPDKRRLYLESEKSLYAIVKASLRSLFSSDASSFSQSQSQGTNLSFNFYDSQSSQSQESLKFSQKLSGKPKTQEKSSTTNISSLRSKFAKNVTPSFSSDRKISRKSEKSEKSWISVDKKSGKNVSSSKSTENWEDVDRESIVMEEFEQKSTDTVMFDDEQSEFFEKAGEFKFEERLAPFEEHSIEIQQHSPKIEIYDDELSEYEFPCVEFGGLETRSFANISLDWPLLKEMILERAQERENEKEEEKNRAQKFHAKISAGEKENVAAEQELKKQLNKESFKQMEIIGQFNLGFILVHLGSDLFIIDQHASDEKYNFEDLEKSTVLQTHKLIHPIELDLPAISENIVVDNLELFQKNGFDFELNLCAEPTKRVKLSRLPYSNSCTFGKGDVEEVIFMLEDAISPGSFCRPSKIRGMLASRACRKSVMIGTALSSTEMQKILDHMSMIEQPWNCPHGRPTIRHLMNLKLLPDQELPKFNH